MSNSFSERNKTTLLEAFETLFNKGDYAGGRRPVTEVRSSQGKRGRMGGWVRMGFGVGFLVVLGGFVAGPNVARAAAAQHHDQAPGFYRLKVGDLEVTALFDGFGVFDQHWLNGTKATMDGVVEAVHEDPRMLDEAVAGFLVNTGKQLILVDAGAGTWWGGGALGRLAGNLRSAGYTPEEVDVVLLTHLHSDHVGGLTTQDGKRVFPNADVYVAKAESDFWLSSEIAAKAPKDVQPFFQSAQAIAAPYINAGKWHTFSGPEPIVDGMQVDDWLGATKRVPLTGVDVRRCDGLRTLEERLHILRRLGSDFRRQPKVAFGLRDVNIGIWKDALSVLSGQAADVIGMAVREQDEVDFFRRVACTAEAGRQAPECSPTPPGASTRIDED